MSEDELTRLKLECQQLSEQLLTSQQTWEQTEGEVKKQCGHLEARVSELTEQNAMLHEEAEKVSLCVCVCVCFLCVCVCVCL